MLIKKQRYWPAMIKGDAIGKYLRRRRFVMLIVWRVLYWASNIILVHKGTQLQDEDDDGGRRIVC